MKNPKKLLIPAMILLLFAGSIPETAQAKKTEQKIIEISIHIQIGRVSKDCQGFGICEFSIDINAAQIIIVRVLPKDDLLQLEFPLEFSKKYYEQFENDVFVMDEDFKISEEISKELGSASSLLIPEGKYQIERTENSLIVNIPQH